MWQCTGGRGYDGNTEIVFTEQAHIDCLGDDILWSIVTFKIASKYFKPEDEFDPRPHMELMDALEVCRPMFKNALVHYTEDIIANMTRREFKAFIYKSKASFATHVLTAPIRAWDRMYVKLWFAGYNKMELSVMVRRMETVFLCQIEKLIAELEPSRRTPAILTQQLIENFDGLYTAAITPITTLTV
jgi:hypothetical protein